MSQNAITFLKKQHDEMKELLAAFAATTDRGLKIRRELLSKIDAELRHHMQLEEEIFYPEFKKAVERKKDKKLYFEAKEEHHVARGVLHDLTRADPGSLAFGGKVNVLKELVEHHMNEEESEMFPLAKEIFTSEELKELAAKMETRKRALETGHGWDRSTVAAHSHA